MVGVAFVAGIGLLIGSNFSLHAQTAKMGQWTSGPKLAALIGLCTLQLLAGAAFALGGILVLRGRDIGRTIILWCASLFALVCAGVSFGLAFVLFDDGGGFGRSGMIGAAVLGQGFICTLLFLVIAWSFRRKNGSASGLQ
jgi:hypothetical protein